MPPANHTSRWTREMAFSCLATVSSALPFDLTVQFSPEKKVDEQKASRRSKPSTDYGQGSSNYQKGVPQEYPAAKALKFSVEDKGKEQQHSLV